MNITAKITMLFDDDGLRIELCDEASGETFVRGELNQEQVCQMLSRLAYTKMSKCEVDFNHVGKKVETNICTGFIDSGLAGEYFRNRSNHSEKFKDAIRKEVEKKFPASEGWENDWYFGSQGSFYEDKEGNSCFRVTVRRWV